ncbi:MAG: hypothetical protein U5M23_08585 [Marinagarivorans sp.]|nr:hypothetical protein [Marinagarivorans sp.]
MNTHTNIGGLVKTIRRLAIVFVLLLGYAYVRLVGDSYALVSIGLVSFCAAAQFARGFIIGALFWRGGGRTGALAGLSMWALSSGFIPCFYLRFPAQVGSLQSSPTGSFLYRRTPVPTLYLV